jgi:hypothetical protein
MTKIDERLAELIQADIDGELPAADRAELTAALERSAAARGFHDELTRMSKLLADTPDVEPPWGLRQRILDNIKLPERSWLSGWLTPASYGLAVAAGVLLAVGVTQVTPQGSEDMSSLVGTMVSRGHELPGSAASELSIDIAEVQGKVRLTSLDLAWAVEFDLQSADTVEVAIDLGDTGLSFGGYAGRDENAGVKNLEVSGEKVRVTNQGSHQFVLFLRRVPESSDGSQEIGIAVNQRGETVFRGLLESRG